MATAISSVPAPKSLLKTSSGEKIRANFLNMIGIEAKLPPAGVPACKQNLAMVRKAMNEAPETGPVVSTNWVHPRTQKVVCTTESLKYDRDADELFAVKRRKLSFDSSPASVSPKRRTKKTLTFGDTVTVVPIPMRTEYSNRVRSRLWSNAVEIYENAARNAFEFASEGWDWRSVVEDEGMYVCSSTGELIHPCHYEIAKSEG